MSKLNSIVIGDFIETLTDYHANGSYKILKENVTLKKEEDFAVMIRTLNFERGDFKNDLIFLNQIEYEYLSKTKVFPDDIIMNKIANPGSIYIMPDLNKPVTLAMNLFLIRFNEKLNQRYMYYLMKINEKYIKKFANGTTTLTITKDSVRGLKFTVPSLLQQNIIEKVLSDLDKKIGLNNKINAELESMAKIIYDYWFVQFDFPDFHDKPYKSSGGKMIWNDELKREIPEGWEIQPLTRAMDIQYGYPFSTRLFNDVDEGFPIVRIRDIPSNSISLFSTEKVDSKYELKKGDLLVGMDGNFHMNLWDKNKCYLNQRCLRIRTKQGSNVSILQTLFETKPYIEAREKNISRTTVGHLSAKDINNLKILIPQNKLGSNSRDLFDSVLKKIIISRNENQKFVDLRDWLLPMLVNGQVTVGDTEE